MKGVWAVISGVRSVTHKGEDIGDMVRYVEGVAVERWGVWADSGMRVCGPCPRPLTHSVCDALEGFDLPHSESTIYTNTSIPKHTHTHTHISVYTHTQIIGIELSIHNAVHRLYSDSSGCIPCKSELSPPQQYLYRNQVDGPRKDEKARG